MDEYAAGPHPQPVPALQREDQVRRRPRPGARPRASTRSRPATTRSCAPAPDGLVEMHRAVDDGKDQSYVLGVLDQEQLRHSLFPLGGSTKAAVRARGRRARAAGRGQAGQPRHLLRRERRHPGLAAREARRPGPQPRRARSSTRPAPRSGRHDGTYAFTIGQRRGLRLGRPAPDGKPRFVLDIEPVSGTVTVGPARAARRAPADRHPAALVRHRAVPARGDRPAACPRRRAPRGGHGRRRHRRGRAPRPGVRHRARSGRGRLRRHPGGRLGDDRATRVSLTSRSHRSAGETALPETSLRSLPAAGELATPLGGRVRDVVAVWLGAWTARRGGSRTPTSRCWPPA